MTEQYLRHCTGCGRRYKEFSPDVCPFCDEPAEAQLLCGPEWTLRARVKIPRTFVQALADRETGGNISELIRRRLLAS